MRITLLQERELCSLWGRRSTLSELEWERLFALVNTELIAGHYTELGALPREQKRELVQHFFIDKVFLTRHTGSHLEHAGALHHFFKNYLKDKIRSEAGIAYTDDPHTDSDDSLWESGPLCGESGPGALLPRAREKASKDASELASSLASDDLGYLLWHHCADLGPRDQFAKEYRIGNYHAKALKLGITRKKGEFHSGYEQTVLGRWLAGVGLMAVPENCDAICEAFAILCAAIRGQMGASHERA